MKKENFYYKKIGDVKTSDAKLFLIKLKQDGKRYNTVKFDFELAGVVVNDSVNTRSNAEVS